MLLGYWHAVSQADPRVVDLYSRHYSSRKNKKGRQNWLARGISGPGETMTLLTTDGQALFGWLKAQQRRDGQEGVCCYVFRNEGPIRSSLLVREAQALAWEKWGRQRLFTYVDPRQVRSSNPGYCFKVEGWNLAGISTLGLHLLELR